MSGGIESGSGAERADHTEDSIRPISWLESSSRSSSPAIPRLTSTLLVPTTIPSSRALAPDVVRPTEVMRPLRPARGTRPPIPSSLSTRANLLSSIRDRSRTTVADPVPLDIRDASQLHDPNNEAPAARRSSLAISGSRRGLPSSLAQRAHVFASIRDRSRLVEQTNVSEDRTPEE